MAGTPAVVLDHEVTLEVETSQVLDGPPPDLFKWEKKKIKFYLVKVMVLLGFL